MVNQLTTIAEFDNFIMEHDMVVVDVYAVWCGPCKMLAPIVEQASSARAKIAFGKVDIDGVEEVSERYGITSIPTVLLFKGGKLVKDNLGYLPLEDLLKLIDSTL